MKKKGFTLVEIIVATLILALIMAGLANLFISTKRYIMHSRFKMSGGELGKYFLDPLQMNVNQSDWNETASDYNATSPLYKGTRTRTAIVIDGKSYTPTYNVTVPPNFDTGSAMRKVRVDINWTEP